MAVPCAHRAPVGTALSWQHMRASQLQEGSPRRTRPPLAAPSLTGHAQQAALLVLQVGPDLILEKARLQPGAGRRRMSVMSTHLPVQPSGRAPWSSRRRRGACTQDGRTGPKLPAGCQLPHLARAPPPPQRQAHLLAVQHAPDGLAALARVGGVAALRDEAALHVVEQAVVEVLDLAEPASGGRMQFSSTCWDCKCTKASGLHASAAVRMCASCRGPCSPACRLPSPSCSASPLLT